MNPYLPEHEIFWLYKLLKTPEDKTIWINQLTFEKMSWRQNLYLAIYFFTSDDQFSFYVHQNYIRNRLANNIKKDETNCLGLGEEIYQNVLEEKSIEHKILKSKVFGLGKDLEKYIYPQVYIKRNGKTKTFAYKKIRPYLDLFRDDELCHDKEGVRYFNYQKSNDDLISYLENECTDYCHKQIWINKNELAKKKGFVFGEQNFNEYVNKYRFFETLLCAEDEGVIHINGIDSFQNATVDYIAKKMPTIVKDYTDYLSDAVNYFKEKYAKIGLSGLTYEYKLGENVKLFREAYGPDEHLDETAITFKKTKAIEELHRIGFIKKYEIKSWFLDDDPPYIPYDYAICLIDEKKIIGKEESNQNDDIIPLTPNGYPDAQFYITKVVNLYYFKGKPLLDLSETANFRIAFDVLYKVTNGNGDAKFSTLETTLKRDYKEFKTKKSKAIKSFFQQNLTSDSNGFLKSAGIGNRRDDGRKLIQTIRGKNIIRFNNKIP